MSPKQKQPKKSEHLKEPMNPPPRMDWLDRIQQFKVHFGRFLWDATGVILFAFGLLVLVGVIGLSKGTLLSRLIEVISVWLGWGSMLIVVMSGLGGALAFKHRRKPIIINWNVSFLSASRI